MYVTRRRVRRRRFGPTLRLRRMYSPHTRVCKTLRLVWTGRPLSSLRKSTGCCFDEGRESVFQFRRKMRLSFFEDLGLPVVTPNLQRWLRSDWPPRSDAFFLYTLFSCRFCYLLLPSYSLLFFLLSVYPSNRRGFVFLVSRTGLNRLLREALKLVLRLTKCKTKG